MFSIPSSSSTSRGWVVRSNFRHRAVEVDELRDAERAGRAEERVAPRRRHARLDQPEHAAVQREPRGRDLRSGWSVTWRMRQRAMLDPTNGNRRARTARERATRPRPCARARTRRARRTGSREAPGESSQEQPRRRRYEKRHVPPRVRPTTTTAATTAMADQHTDNARCDDDHDDDQKRRLRRRRRAFRPERRAIAPPRRRAPRGRRPC